MLFDIWDDMFTGWLSELRFLHRSQDSISSAGQSQEEDTTITRRLIHVENFTRSSLYNYIISKTIVHEGYMICSWQIQKQNKPKKEKKKRDNNKQ